MEARELLDQLDQTWYSMLNPRWMDLLGDYVGEELFLIDGDAICQQVLNDPLVALGKSQDCSFQLLHAVWGVEKLVLEFVNRRCNFEIVFFERNKYLTLYGGDDTSAFVVSSRRLARTILKNHLERLDVPVTTFEAPPFCVLCNDGSQVATIDCSDLALSAALLQRTFIFIMLSQDISVLSLEAMEFRGPKIVSWVYEQSRLLRRQKKLLDLIINCQRQALKILPIIRKRRQLIGPSTIPTPHAIETWIETATNEYFQVNPIDASGDALFTVFLLHIIILPYVSIGDRSQKPVILHPDLETTLRSHVMPKIFNALNRAFATDDVKRRPDMDGRIFLNLLAVFTQNPGPNLNFVNLFGCGAADAVGLAADSLYRHVEAGRLSFSPSVLSSALGKWHSNEMASLPLPEEKPIMALLPFQNGVFDECLKPILSASEAAPPGTTPLQPSTPSPANGTEGTSEAARWFTNSTTFTDDQHWHNNRKITEGFQEKRLVLYGEKVDDDRPLTKWQLARMRKNRERRHQVHMRNIHRNAATLTGAKGALLQRLAIPTTKILIKNLSTHKLPAERRSNQQSLTRPKKEPKAKEPKLNSTERLRQKIKDEKAIKTLSESEAWWKQQLAHMEKLPTGERKAEYLGRVRKNAKRMEDSWLRTETLLYQIHLDVSRWIYDRESDEPGVQAQYSVGILRVALEIHNIGVASDSAKTFLRSLLETIGLSDLDILRPSPVKSAETTKQPLTFQPVRFAHRDRTKPPLYPFLRLPSHPIEFQLEHYGLYMDRSMDGQIDARVSFVPDAWQRDVLDRLDRRESVLVVAPTSAGKTFVSYYAMEQVLRESDDGVLVYVAPTKALVNQVVAEISARYGKTLNTGTVWAAHSRDWRVHQPQKCQILVTVPEMLAIMLLSPVLASQWLPRLRWIVLDEIHSIGQQEGGAVWEQLILFAPCPIIGLSATIGNPEEFSRWLDSVQEQHGFKYALIHHKHRYSHLRKFAYTMSGESPEFDGFACAPPSSIKPIYIHPMSALTSGARIIPEDLALESNDCLTLFRAMSKVAEQHSEKRDQLAMLDPRIFFAQSSGRLLTQRDVIVYEAKLKELLADWSKEAEAHKTILRPIGEALSEGHDLCEPFPTRKGVYENLIHLLHDLQHRGNLPAILFNFDRVDCNEMAQHLVKILKTAETRWKQSSPQWQNKLTKWEAWVAASKQRQRATERSKKSQSWVASFKQRQSAAGRPNKSEASEDERLFGSTSWEESFDPEEPLPEFSFAGPWTSYSKAEMERDIEELKYTSRKPIKEWQIQALKMGIAVHHAGVGRTYRALVESLFRIGFIRVVIATGTLALGINMPVKTSIFDEREEEEWISANGEPLIMFPLVAHLYHTEPFNLALVALLQNGVVHRICDSIDLNPIDTKRSLVGLLAHLFARRPLPRLFSGEGALERLRPPKSPSQIILPPLSPDAYRVISDHNSLILETFRGYARTFATQHLSDSQDNLLPLSKETLPSSSDQEATFMSFLRCRANKVATTSSFVANSGVTDTSLGTAVDLARTTRAGLHLDKNAIPGLDTLLALNGRVLNAYILDYFTHGQYETLIKVNRIRQSDVWYELEEFALALATLQTGLEHYFKAVAADPSLDSESSDSEEDGEEEEEGRSEAEVEAEAEAEAQQFEPGATSIFPVKPKNITEGDWKVYRAVVLTRQEFDVKFKAMWA
ncbi:hypothetical protein FRC01_011870 [Tulasnella sp. 417]|nr:hypothetical protein FRC01_011870 [Tulasnella sp. 417]